MLPPQERPCGLQSCPDTLCLLANDVANSLCQGHLMLQLTGHHLSRAMHLASAELGAAKQLRHGPFMLCFLWHAESPMKA